MTMILDKSSWGNDLSSSCVLAEAIGAPVILIGDTDKGLVSFEMRGTASVTYLATDIALQDLLVRAAGAAGNRR
jgi:hypothetical protein